MLSSAHGLPFQIWDVLLSGRTVFNLMFNFSHFFAWCLCSVFPLI